VRFNSGLTFDSSRSIPASGPLVIIVFNPAAGRRRAHLLWRVLDVLVANGVRLDLAETLRPGHAEALAREAVQRGEPMVVAAGGDGTIAEVANGLMGSSTHLGVIPLGTANVLAHELAQPFSPRSVAAALAFGRTCRLWPGQANNTGGTRLFVQMLVDLMRMWCITCRAR
jgi:diacylglycerol kinase (ATP)